MKVTGTTLLNTVKITETTLLYTVKGYRDNTTLLYTVKGYRDNTVVHSEGLLGQHCCTQ